jgi:hypothetical protein
VAPRVVPDEVAHGSVSALSRADMSPDGGPFQEPDEQ